VAENNNAEEWLIAYAARIDAQINQQKRGATGTTTKPPAPLVRAGESPTREPTMSAPPPRAAHSSPPPSRTANDSPTTRRESKSPSPEKRPTYRLKTPSGYKLENWTTKRDADYACKLNKHWKENINPQSKRMLLFNTLFSSEKLKNIEEPYERELYFSYIRDSDHPFYREPYDKDELSLWTRNTTSIDALYSKMLPCHPTRFTHLHVFSCTTRDWLVPVISDHIKANTLAKYLATKLEPFYAEGKGDIICPVCITYIRGETFWPMRYSRGEFMTHFERMHQELEGTAYLGFATGYSTRMYEAKTIYAYCMANTHANPAGKRSANPFKEEEPREKDSKRLHKGNIDNIYGVFYITLLRDLFERTNTVLDHHQLPTLSN
jgi:hypothetical protein